MQRILPCLHDLVPDSLAAEVNAYLPVLRMIRIICEVRLILSIDIITINQINDGKTLLNELEGLIPVILLYFC